MLGRIRRCTWCLALALVLAAPVSARTDGEGAFDTGRWLRDQAGCPLPGQPFIGLVGHARVIDGDTLEIISAEPITVHLCGIDAPELGQTCVSAEGQAWPCGETAADALRELIGDEIVLCAANSTNRYGRMLAVCGARGLSLNAMMLGLGAWAGGFMQPWEWRESQD